MKSSPVAAILMFAMGGVVWVATEKPAAVRDSGGLRRESASDLEAASQVVERAEGKEAEAENSKTSPQARKVLRNSIRMKVTAYCLCKICCGKWADLPNRITSTGDDARIYDGVAADPKLFPYRTRLEIPGIGVKEVDDTGGGMRQSAKQGIYHIDVRMPSHSAARQWGVRWLNVKVLE